MGGAMRIIAGAARGRGLVAPAGEKTRPTSDKLRGALFNILASRVVGARVLDLFAGTGAFALEAMSRGASSAVLVDSDRRAIEAIRRNASAVLGDSANAQVEIIESDYRRAVGALAGAPFDIAFFDPPYALFGAYADAIARLSARNLLADDVVLVCERAKGSDSISAPGFLVYDARAYGDTAVDFLRREI
jgi:16S rRNA (guanine966-N2)-methyltransferase